jgi:hypothetical protein
VLDEDDAVLGPLVAHALLALPHALAAAGLAGLEVELGRHALAASRW